MKSAMNLQALVLCSDEKIVRVLRRVLNDLEIAVELHRLFPADWKVDGYSHLLVNSEAFERLKRGDSAEEIRQSWNAGLEKFRRVRDSILIYK